MMWSSLGTIMPPMAFFSADCGVVGDDHGTVCVRAAGCTDGVHKRLEQLVDNIVGFLGAAGPLLRRADDTGFVHALEDQTVVIVLEGGTDLFPDGGQRSLCLLSSLFLGWGRARVCRRWCTFRITYSPSL